MRFLTTLFLLFTIPVFGQTAFQKTKLIQFKDQNITEKDFFKTQQQKLGINTDARFEKQYSNTDRNGILHTKYKQFYKGLLVIGSGYVLHSKNNIVNKASGNIYPIDEINSNPSLNEAEIINIAQLHWQYTHTTIEDFHPPFLNKLLAYNKGLRIVGANKKMDADFKLAYSIELTNSLGTIHQQYYMDAHTGEVLFTFDEIEAITVPAKAQSIYYGEVDFNVESVEANKYILKDLSKGNGIFIESKWYDLTEYISPDNSWNFEGTDRSVIDAFYSTSAYYDFLKEKFNRNSIDNKGMALICDVNRKSSGGAYWINNKALLGAGNCDYFSPLTSLAIVGHEFTHGLIDHTANLLPLAGVRDVGDGICDIFGNAVEYYKNKENFDWYIGSKVTKSARGLRSMKNPNELKSPKFYKGEFWNYTNIGYQNGEYDNNGVLIYWYYLIAHGEQGVNEMNKAYDVTGIGMEKSLQLVYHTLINYLTPTSDYPEFHQYSLEAAKDLFGKNSTEYESVVNAWDAVGLNGQITESELDPDNFDFSILLNGQTDFFHFFCYLEIENLDLGFKNRGTQIIKKGTLVKLDISSPPDFDIQIEEQHFEQILDKDVEIGETITFKDVKINPQDLEELEKNHFAYKNELTLENGNFKYYYRQFSNINLRKTYEEYSSNLLIPIYECHPQYENIRLWFWNIRGCRPYRPTDSARIEIYNAETQYSVKLPLSKENHILSNPTNDNVENYFDFSAIENLEDYFFDIYYNDTYVKTDTFSKYIFQSLGQDDIIDFENNILDTRINYTYSQNVKKTIQNKQLKLKNKWIPTRVQTCYTLDNYFKIDQNSKSAILDFSFCSDAENMNKPVLIFDLKMKDNLNYNSYTNQFLHLIKIYQNDIPIDMDLIVSTDGQFKTLEIPLDNSKPGKITFSTVLHGTEMYFDNIKVIDLKPSATDNIILKNHFTIENPISNVLNISTNDLNQIWDFELIDITGKSIFVEKNISTNLTKDVSNLTTGLYFYRITDSKNKQYSGKIVIVQ